MKAPITQNSAFKIAEMSLKSLCEITSCILVYVIVSFLVSLHFDNQAGNVLQSHVQHFLVLILVKEATVLINDPALALAEAILRSIVG